MRSKTKLAGALLIAAALLVGAIIRSNRDRFLQGPSGSGATRSPGGAQSSPGEVGSRSGKYVLEVLRTRETHPRRTPDEWRRFMTELEAWHRTNKVECISTLMSGQWTVLVQRE